MHGEEPMQEQFGRSCGLKGTQMGAAFQQECKPCRGPVLELFLKNCSLWEGHMLERADHKGLQLQGKTHRGAGEKCEEEGMAETSCYKLTATPIPYLLCHSGGDKEESGVKLSWEERGGWGKVL